MNRLILADLLATLLHPSDRLVVLDVGARDALADPRWAALPRAAIHGFDPDPVECARLNAEATAAGMDARYHPVALWSASETRPFYENQAPGGGSFFEQNRALTDRWKFECIDGQKTNSRDIFYPTVTREIAAMRLDDWALAEGVQGIDFLKMNIQGAELDVLRGAGDLLDDVLGIVTEVSFVESYHGRPMFADIDRFLRTRRFEFFGLISDHLVGRVASPIEAIHCPALRAVSHGQLIEGHALYLRDPIARPLPVTAGIRLAMLAEAFGQVEYAFEIVSELARTDERLAPIFDAAAASYRQHYGAA